MNCGSRLRSIRRSKVIAVYNGPIPPFLSLLSPAQRNLPLLGRVVLSAPLCKDAVRDFKGAVRCASVSGRIPGTIKLLHCGLADRAKEGSGQRSILIHFPVNGSGAPSPKISVPRLHACATSMFLSTGNPCMPSSCCVEVPVSSDAAHTRPRSKSKSHVRIGVAQVTLALPASLKLAAQVLISHNRINAGGVCDECRVWDEYRDEYAMNAEYGMNTEMNTEVSSISALGRLLISLIFTRVA
jgi:hypothetical protein